MEHPKGIKNTIAAASMFFGAVITPTQAISQDTGERVGEIILSCIPESNSTSLSTTYTVQRGDTLGKISQELGFSIENLGRFLTRCPGYENWDPNRIRAGDEILVLTVHGNEIMEELKERFIAEEQREIIEGYLAEGNFDIIKELYGYRLFRDSPTPLLGRGEEILGNMFVQNPRALGPRVVDWQYEYLTVCANLSRSWDRYMLSDTSESPLQSMLLAQNINAWNFTEAYSGAGYEQLFDMREYFTRNVQRGVIPVRSEYRDTYRNELAEMLRYLEESGTPGSKMPAFFLYTGAIGDINSNPNFNPNSHVFSYVGNYTTDPFEANTFMPVRNGVIQTEWTEEIDAIDYLIYTIQNLGGMQLALSSTMYSTIRNNLSVYGDEIFFIIDGERVSVQDELENNTLRVSPDSQIQIGGAIVMDGLKIGISDNPDEREKMNMRLLPFWAVLSLDVFYPTEILERPQEVNTGSSGVYNNLASQLPISSFIDVRRGETILERYYTEIAEQVFGKNLESLDEDERTRVEEIYSVHSLAHQILGLQAAGGSDWNDGATNINAPIPFYGVDAVSLSSIRSIYFQFVSQKERDYLEILAVQDVRPYIEVVVFGRAAPRQLLAQVELQLDSSARRYMRDLSSIQREVIAQRFFAPERLEKEHLNAGDTFIIPTEEISIYLQLMRESNLRTHELYDVYGDMSLDMTLIQRTSSNPLTQSMLAHIIANESYVNPCVDCSNFYRDFIWGLQTHFASRRGAKDLVYKIHQHGWNAVYDETIAFISQNTGIIEELQELGITIPPFFPSVNSMGDFQVRFQVLYGEGGRNIQVGGVMYTTLESLISGTSNYTDIIETLRESYPEIVESDMQLVRNLMSEVRKDIPDILNIQAILKNLLRLNDGTHSNIIGKIIELQVMEERVSTSLLDNIMAQYIRTGGNQNQDIEARIGDFSNAVILANNMGEVVQLTTFTENYIIRIIDTFRQKYSTTEAINYPTIRSNRLNQIMYSTWTFRRHSENYQTILESFNGLSPEDEAVRNELIGTLEMVIGSQNNTEYINAIFSIHQGPLIREFLTENGETTSFFPTNSEISGENDIRQKLFRYINNRELISQRLQKVPLTDTQKNILFIPLYATAILAFHRWAKIIGSGLARGQWRDEYRTTKRNKKKVGKKLQILEERKKTGLPMDDFLTQEKEYRKLSKKIKRIQRISDITPTVTRLVNTVTYPIYIVGNIISKITRGPDSKVERIFNQNISKISNSDLDRYIETQRVKDIENQIGTKIEKIILGNVRNDSSDSYVDGRYSIGVDSDGEAFIKRLDSTNYELSSELGVMSKYKYQDGYYSIHPPISKLDAILLESSLDKYTGENNEYKIAAE